MSDDDPVEAFVEGSVEPFGEENENEQTGPQTRDMEAELRARTGVDAGGNADDDFSEVDADTATAFWSTVIMVNAGILLMALGPVVYALRGRALVSLALVVAGVLALVRAYTVYRSFDADDGDEEESDDGGVDGDDDGDANDTATDATTDEGTVTNDADA